MDDVWRRRREKRQQARGAAPPVGAPEREPIAVVVLGVCRWPCSSARTRSAKAAPAYDARDAIADFNCESRPPTSGWKRQPPRGGQRARRLDVAGDDGASLAGLRDARIWPTRC